ncbi:MAG: nicotinate-nucleotide pyrophosphorylase (carboxylating) [Myxococcota bacterium]|jgi:nicotinate-nucleotide pyrophosphorylase (carboxylating)
MIADPLVDRLVALALEEDLALGDVTTDATIDAETRGIGRLAAKETLIVAGQGVAERVFAAVDSDIVVEWQVAEGSEVGPGDVIGLVHGRVRSLLKAERPALNFMQRLSGTATLSRRFADAVKGTGARVVDTRKTTPGWRTLEKRAVTAGGCYNHRWSLGSGILIKDNHVDSGGGVAATIERVREYAPHGLKVEIEVRDEQELDEALGAGADIVLLDNMDLATLKRCADKTRAAGALSEASGGVTLDTVRAIAEAGVDLISSGALTHSAPSMDVHMKVKPV